MPETNNPTHRSTLLIAIALAVLVICISGCQPAEPAPSPTTPADTATPLPPSATPVPPTTTPTSTITPTPIPLILWQQLEDSEVNQIGGNATFFLAEYTFDFPSIYPDYSENQLPYSLQSFLDSIYLGELGWKPQSSWYPLNDNEYIITHNSQRNGYNIFYLVTNIPDHFSPDEFCQFLEQATLEGYGFALSMGSVEDALIYLEEKLGNPKSINLEDNGYCSNFDVESDDYRIILNQYAQNGILLSDMENHLEERKAGFEILRSIYRDTKFTNINIEYPDQDHALISFDYEISQFLDLQGLKIIIQLGACSEFLGWDSNCAAITDIEDYTGSVSGESAILVDFTGFIEWGGSRGCQSNGDILLVNDTDEDIIFQTVDQPMLIDPVNENE